MQHHDRILLRSRQRPSSSSRADRRQPLIRRVDGHLGPDYWMSGMMRVGFFTTEAAEWGVGAAFKNRFPQTTRLARAVLGPDVAARMFGR